MRSKSGKIRPDDVPNHIAVEAQIGVSQLGFGYRDDLAPLDLTVRLANPLRGRASRVRRQARRLRKRGVVCASVGDEGILVQPRCIGDSTLREVDHVLNIESANDGACLHIRSDINGLTFHVGTESQRRSAFSVTRSTRTTQQILEVELNTEIGL